VKTDAFTQAPAERIPQPTEITNVYAVMKERIHRPPSAFGAGHRAITIRALTDVLDSKNGAPGANDDGSGTAVSLECARVLSKLKFPSTIIFLTVAGEEQGLYGSRHFAQMAREQGWKYRGRSEQTDIVGGDKSVGQDAGMVRVFPRACPSPPMTSNSS